MPDQKISQLASGTNAQTGDLFVIARSGANYSLTTAQLFAPTQSANSATGLFLVNSDTGSSATARVTFSTQGGNAYIEARRNAGGSLVFNVGAADRWVMNNSGHFLASADNVSDIGASGANRPRDLWIGRNAAISGDAYVGIAYAGASGLSISPAGNLSFAETVGISYVNIFRQSNSAATVVANGYKYTNTANGFASSLNALWARSAIRLSAGGIQFYADPASTVANGTDMTPTLRASIDSAGNLGLGVTPSAASATTLQFPNGVTVSNAGTAASFAHNAVFNSGWKYVATGAATLYQKYLGAHAWFIAPSGTAGNAISFTQAMTLDASGNLGVGTTSIPAGQRLRIAGGDVGLEGQYLYMVNANASIQLGAAQNARITNTDSTNSLDINRTGASSFITLSTAGAERMRLDSAGNLGLGVTPSAWAGVGAVFQHPSVSISASSGGGTDTTAFTTNAIYNGTNWLYRTTAAATRYDQWAGSHRWFTAPSGTAGATVAFTMSWQINASGHLLAGTDNLHDIGASGATRPRDVFVARNVVAANEVRAPYLMSITSGNSMLAFFYAGTSGVMSLGNASGNLGGSLELTEDTAPAAPATNKVRIYAEDNGSGKTRIMARFATGAAVQIAIEP